MTLWATSVTMRTRCICCVQRNTTILSGRIEPLGSAAIGRQCFFFPRAHDVLSDDNIMDVLGRAGVTACASSIGFPTSAVYAEMIAEFRGNCRWARARIFECWAQIGFLKSIDLDMELVTTELRWRLNRIANYRRASLCFMWCVKQMTPNCLGRDVATQIARIAFEARKEVDIQADESRGS